MKKVPTKDFFRYSRGTIIPRFHIHKKIRCSFLDSNNNYPFHILLFKEYHII